jgi:hypothetical protein
MKVRMLEEQNSPKYGLLEKNKEYDLDPEDERKYIKRGIAENVSAPGYVSKSTKGKKKEEIKEVKGNVRA